MGFSVLVLNCEALVERSHPSGDDAIRAELIAKGVVRTRRVDSCTLRRVADALAVVARNPGSAYSQYAMLVRAAKREMELFGDEASVSNGPSAAIAEALRLRLALSIKSTVSSVFAQLVDFGARRGALPNQKSLGFFSFLKVNGRNAP